MRFKEFLTEAIVQPATINRLEVSEAINFLNQHCKSGLEAIRKKSVLYRGENRSITGKKGFALVDTSTLIRTSEATNNTYQLCMDAVLPSQYASRTKSLICSTDYSYAFSFAKHGEIYAVIPVDNTDICISNTDDFLGQEIKSNLYDYGDMGDFSECLMMLMYTLAPEIKTKKFSVDLMDSLFAKEDSRLTGLIFSSVASYDSFSFKPKTKLSQADQDHIQYYCTDGGRGPKNAGYRELTLQALNNSDIILKPKTKAIIQVLRNAPADKQFSTLMSKILTPRSLQLSINKPGDKLPKQRECWFEGKAVFINMEIFTDIQNQVLEIK